MEILILLGLLLGLAGGIAATNWFYRKNNRQSAREQSVILLEKIQHVCKLITIEGEFSEVFAHRDKRPEPDYHISEKRESTNSSRLNT